MKGYKKVTSPSKMNDIDGSKKLEITQWAIDLYLNGKCSEEWFNRFIIQLG